MSDEELINLARSLVKPVQLSRPDMSAATVGCAILTNNGNIYTGVCIDVSCGIGFCAEHAAVAEMIKAGETAIEVIVAAHESDVISPCGRCRELLVQVDRKNLETRVLLDNNRTVRLSQLLPEHWLA